MATVTVDAAGAHLDLEITGMTCGGCARRVETALQAVPGVERAAVNPAVDRADISYDPDLTAPDALVEAVKEVGFGVREHGLRLSIRGMTCAGCAQRVERALLGVPGVLRAAVNPALDVAEVRLAQTMASPATLVRAVEQAGYAAAPELVDQAAAPRDGDNGRARPPFELIAAALLTAPLVLQMLLMPLGTGLHLSPWVELLLATPVQLWLGRRFYVSAWSAARHRAGNMDQLVALGTSAAYLYSVWLVISLGEAAAGRLYFEASAVIITLVLTGKWLEARAKRSAAAALTALMALRPERARVLRAGTTVEIPIDALAIGDIVVVKPGERLPVDGVIVKGDSELDESLLTGESMPVMRSPGDGVVAGAINGLGLLRVRAERLGEDTTLAKIARLVAGAQAGKAPIQKLVDRISGVFVPAVLGLAAATLLGWLALGVGFEPALIAAVSVLVIACPCALGLATPAALVAGTGAAARAGIVIRDIEALERAHGIATVVFDKTGTLTHGQPEVQRLAVAAGVDEAELLTVAASAQLGSEHPLGRGMVKAAAARGLDLQQPGAFEAVVGRGLVARLGEHEVRVGQAGHVGADPSLEAAARAGTEDGLTMVWVARDGRVLGLVGLADAVRDDARDAVAALQHRGIRTVMLTGDHRQTATRIGRELGIDEVIAEVRPDEKAQRIEALTRSGGRVAMVGDGVNDAPALAAADLGIAMGTGADVALETAGMTLMRPAPSLVVAALDVAERTRRKIRQNLFWAFGYNLCAIPLAVMGMLSPAVAGAAMAASSLSVVVNALRLKRWRPRT